MFVCSLACNPNSLLCAQHYSYQVLRTVKKNILASRIYFRLYSNAVEKFANMYEISFVDDDLEDFRIQDLLGEGSFAQVYKCVETKSQTVFALKEFDTKHKEFDEKAVEQEVLVWTDVIHENIVRLYVSFTTGSYIYFVLEYVDGGSLFNHMMQRHKYSEKEAANIMKQVRFY